VAAPGTKLANYGYALLNAIRSDMILYVMIGAYTALAIAYFAAMGNLGDMVYGNYTKVYLTICLAICPTFAVIVGITRIVHRIDNRRKVPSLGTPRCFLHGLYRASSF